MSEMSPEDAARDLLERWYAAWNDHDVEAVLALTTDDVRYEDPSSAQPLMHGHREVGASVRAAFLAVPDLHLEKHEDWVTPGGAAIASWFTFSGTFQHPLDLPGRPRLAPTGKPIEAQGMDRSEIREGLLGRHQIYWDMLDVGRQMAFLPPRDSAMDRFGYRLQNLSARIARGRR